MARYSGVTWDPSPNFRRGPTRKVRVVLHRMAGSYAGGLSWLKNPTSQVSANFTVDNVAGEGRQLVDTADIAWAQADYNDDSISIEIGGEPRDPVSDAAWVTITEIVRQANEIDGVSLVLAVAPDLHGLAYHGQLGVAGGNHPDCPGPVVIAGLPAVLAAAKPTPPGGSDMYSAATDPISGGSWLVTPDGGLQTADGAPYLGNLIAHPEWHADPPSAIAFWKGDGTDVRGNGYVIWTQCDKHGIAHTYHFRRSGADRSPSPAAG